MKIFSKCKDGGKDSPVDAYFLCEFKNLFSIALLKFNAGSRENYHSHAFDAYTWFLSGDLMEARIYDNSCNIWYYPYKRRLLPKFTPKENLHRVIAYKDSWCFTIRGPWVDRWIEYNEHNDETIHLTHGRKIVAVEKGVKLENYLEEVVSAK